MKREPDSPAHDDEWWAKKNDAQFDVNKPASLGERALARKLLNQNDTLIPLDEWLKQRQ